MKTTLHLLILSLLFSTGLPAENPAVWRSKGGHTFEGEFIRLHPGESVMLRGTDGFEVNVPLQALDADSQAQALREAREAGQSTTAPLFTHQTPVYTLNVNGQKQNLIQMEFKDRGRPLPYGNPDLHLFMAEVIQKKYHAIDLRETKLLEKDRESASFELQFENDVVVFLNIQLLDDGIEFHYWRKEPAGTPRLDLHISMELPALVKWDLPSRTYQGDLFPDGIPQEQLEKRLEDYVLTSRYHTQPAQKHAFSEHHKKLYSAKSFSLQLPHTTGELELASPAEPNQGKVGLYLYDGKLLAEGTMIRFGNFHSNDKDKAATFSIRFK